MIDTRVASLTKRREATRDNRTIRLLAPVSQPIGIVLGVTTLFSIAILAVAIATTEGPSEATRELIETWGRSLVPSFAMAFPAAITLVGLAHVAVLGRDIDIERHRGYLSALSAACLLVVAGILTSGILISVSRLGNPNELIPIVPLLPLLVGFVVIGVQVGRFNNVDADRESAFLAAELDRIAVRIIAASPVEHRRARDISLVHFFVALLPAIGIIYFGGDISGTIFSALGTTAIFAFIALVGGLGNLLNRVSTDLPSRLLGTGIYWFTTAIVLAAFVVAAVRSESWVGAVLTLPFVLVQISIALFTARSGLTLASLIDTVADRYLKRRRRKLSERHEVLLSELTAKRRPDRWGILFSWTGKSRRRT